METANPKILSGKEFAQHRKKLIQDRIDKLTAKFGHVPKMSLATIQVVDSPDTQLYSKSLKKILDQYGIEHIEIVCRSTDELEKKANSLFTDKNLTGVMLFSPIPPSINPKNVFLNMPLRKDVEGRTFIKRNPFGVFSPTAKAAMALLESIKHLDPKFTIKGKHAVMVGHSDLVGKPTAILLSDDGATVTVCHQYTQNLNKYVADADILIVAIGRPGVVKAEWVKDGAVVIDVGENMVDGKIVGDIDFEATLKRASYISPVPGGVGPLTNLMVIENLLTLYEFDKDGANGNR